MTSPRHFLRVSDLAQAELLAVLRNARRMKQEPRLLVDSYRGEAVACYFEKPSTRTRVSFEVACHRLGMLPIMLRPDELQLGRGETIDDTARVLAGYARATVMRVFSHKMLEELATASAVPVINALSDDHHPCQALADVMTIQEVFGELRGRRLAYIGDANNVAHSLMEAGALAGMHVVLASPPGYGPDIQIEADARLLADASGGSITVLGDPSDAVAEADVVYSDVFVSMGDDDEAQERRRAFAGFQVTAELMALASRDAIFMHCLPAHRGQEVAAEVIDGRRSVVFQQAANRMPTEQALLYALVHGDFDLAEQRK